jgi:hypothetical protein
MQDDLIAGFCNLVIASSPACEHDKMLWPLSSGQKCLSRICAACLRCPDNLTESLFVELRKEGHFQALNHSERDSLVSLYDWRLGFQPVTSASAITLLISDVDRVAA